MTDPRLVRYAALICDYSLEIEEGHRVLLRSEPAAEPLVLALAEEAWKRGADPSVWLDPPTVADRVLREGNDDQLRHCSPVAIEVMRTFDAAVNVLAPTNDRARSTIPPDRQRLHDEGQAELARIAYERLAVIPWMVCAYPTAAAAQEAQMSTWSYEEFVYRACLLDEPDPAAAWRALAERQKRLCDRLTGAREVRIQTAAGTDLTLGVDGQPWESSSGLRNLPDGEVFCSPHPEQTRGVVLFDLPSLMYGRRFERVRLRFEEGRVVEATAEAGAEALQQLLDTDDGAAPARRARDRHQRRHHPRHRQHAVRREDRRHVPLRPRPGLRAPQGDEHVLDPLGPGRRPAPGRLDHRGRAGHRARRQDARLMDPFDDLYARVIVEHSLAVAAGQLVLIEGPTLAAPLAEAIHRAGARRRRPPDRRAAAERLPGRQGSAGQRRGARPARLAQVDRLRPGPRAGQAACRLEHARDLRPARRARDARLEGDAPRPAAPPAAHRPRRGDLAHRPGADRLLRAGGRRLARRVPRDPVPGAAARPARPGCRLAPGRRAPAAARRAPGDGRRAALPRAGHRPSAARRRPHLGLGPRRGEPAGRRGVHRPHRGLRGGRGDVRLPVDLGGTRGRRRAAPLRARPRRRGDRAAAARRSSRRPSRWTTARAVSARSPSA